VLINQGRVEQIAPPQELFDRPESLFAATFVGEPTMNVFDARLLDQDGGFGLSLGRSRIALDRDWLGKGEPISPSKAYLAGVRPQHVTLADAGATGVNVVHGTVFAVETLGSRIIFDVEAEGTVVRILTSTDTGRRYPHQIGTPIAFRIAPEQIYLFEAQTGRTVRQAQFTDSPGHFENGFAPQGARKQ